MSKIICMIVTVALFCSVNGGLVVANSFEFEPLPICGKDVVAEHQRGVIEERELNTYINMRVWFEPHLTDFLVYSTEAEMKEFKKEQLESLARWNFINAKVKDAKDDARRAEKRLKYIEKIEQQKRGSKDSLAKMIEGKGFTVDQLKTILVKNEKEERYCNSKLKDMTFDYFIVQHILISTKERSGIEAKQLAEKVKKRLESGETFKKLAKKYSDYPDWNSRGVAGQYPFFQKCLGAVETLPLLKICAPIKTESGYHIIKVEGREKKKLDQLSKDAKQLKRSEIIQDVITHELKLMIYL